MSLDNNINKNQKTYIIAEIGVNHNGKLKKAIQLINTAKKIGADAVKFQSYDSKNLASKNTAKTKYQILNTSKSENHYKMLKKLELSKKEQIKLMHHSKRIKIDFFSTPYDVNNAMFLKRIGVKIFKVSSADLADFALNKYLSKQKETVIISTGMSTVKDISRTLKLYKKKKNVILMHCVSNYPCSDKSLNLRAINLLKKKFKRVVGFSDHSKGYLAACLSVSLGAKVIEKHLTHNKRDLGPDHKSSLDPKEFRNYIKKIRQSELMLGKNIKEIQEEELNMLHISRKSIFFNKNLKKNQIIKKDDLIFLRPGNGLHPFMINTIVGKKTLVNVKKNSKVNTNIIR